MRSALWRIFTLAFLVGLFHLPMHALDLFHDGQAFAETRAARQEPPAKPKRSRTSRIHLAPTALGLTTIQNLRTASSPGLTRLVLDLDAKARPSKHPKLQAEGVTIEIPNATLSQLVIDVVPSSDPLTAPPVDLTPGLELPLPAPPQPAQPRAKSFKTIVIDPGHGGKDPGARGQRGTEEKDITLKVALKLRDLLSKQPGIRVLMTRDRDEFVELEDRAKFANGQEADLFVSIHVNSHPQRSVKGIEIYHFGEAKDQRALEVAARENGTPLNSTGVGWEYLVADLLTAKKIEASLELAWTAKEAMVTNLNNRYSLVDHGVKTAPFYVLRFTSMPSILAEIAYISNSAEEDMLRTGLFTTRVAEALMEGVNTFLASAKIAPR
ncbi:MAG: N-acetylmuramoyl-L-alanine amidase [Nitrospirae bacterium]|nr:MAG: N-acetylmuramoyl-L-alanine amidase [Nitrospirota bacterium]